MITTPVVVMVAKELFRISSLDDPFLGIVGDGGGDGVVGAWLLAGVIPHVQVRAIVDEKIKHLRAVVHGSDV